MDKFVWFLLIGLCAGWLAGILFKGGGFGLVGNLIVGVLGAILGGFLAQQLGLAASSMLGVLLIATGGAIVLLALLQVVAKKKPAT